MSQKERGQGEAPNSPSPEEALEKWVSIQETALAILLASEVGLALDRSKAQGELARRIRSIDEVKRQIGAYAKNLQETLTTNRTRADQLASALASLEDL